MLWKKYVESVWDSLCFPDDGFYLPWPMMEFLSYVDRECLLDMRSTEFIESHFWNFWFELQKIEDVTDRIWGATLFTSEKCPKDMVLVNSLMNRQRMRFTLCHELGHVIIGRFSIPFAKGVDIESVCDEFAAQLLVPTTSMREKFKEFKWSISDTAEHFDVSYDCMRLCLFSRFRESNYSRQMPH